MITHKQARAIIKAWNKRNTTIQNPDQTTIYIANGIDCYPSQKIDELDEEFWTKLKKILDPKHKKL